MNTSFKCSKNNFSSFQIKKKKIYKNCFLDGHSFAFATLSPYRRVICAWKASVNFAFKRNKYK